MIKTAVVYRTLAKGLKNEHDTHNYNDGDVPQFEIAVFSDGRVAQRWKTTFGSSVWWDSWDDLCKVHIYAHPDYGTKVVWNDGTEEEL